MTSLFIPTSWRLKYDTYTGSHTPGDAGNRNPEDRIGKANASNLDDIQAAISGAGEFPEMSSDVTRFRVYESDTYFGDPENADSPPDYEEDADYKDRTEIQSRRFVEYGVKYSYEFSVRFNEANEADGSGDNDVGDGKFYNADTRSLIFFQLHQSSAAGGSTNPADPPPFSLRLQGDKVRLKTHSPDTNYDGVPESDNYSVFSSSINENQWYDFEVSVQFGSSSRGQHSRIHVSFKESGSAIIKEQLTARTEIVGYGEDVGPFTQMGLYRIGGDAAATGESYYYHYADFKNISVTEETGEVFVGSNEPESEVPGLVSTISGGTYRANEHGFWGDDYITGSSAAETINGGYGSDILVGVAGAQDKLYGVEGDDTIYAEDASYNYELDYATGDTYIGDIVTGDAGEDHIYGSRKRDKLFGGSETDWIYGGDGNDSIEGNDGNDSIEGNYGADELFGGSGDDTIKGGGGDDLIYARDDSVNDRGHDTILAGTGNDTVYGGNGQSTIRGGIGNDMIYGGRDYNDAAVDYLYGDGGNDYIVSEQITDPTSFQQPDGDRMFGGSGNDTLVSGKANDRLNGGNGNDVFEFEDRFGYDIIEDFETGSVSEVIDVIDLRSISGIDDYTDLFNNHVSDIGGQAVFEALDGSGDKIVIEGVLESQLNSNDFWI